MAAKKTTPVKDISVTVTVDTFLKIAGMTVGTIVLLLAIHRAAHALTLVATSIFLAVALNAPVHWVSEHLPGKVKGSRSLATTLAFLFVVIVLGAFIASIVPPFVKQTNNFIHAAPALVRDFQDQNSSVGHFIRKYHLEKQVSNVSGELQAHLKNIGSTAFSTFKGIGSSAFAMLTVLAMTFMMLVEGPAWVALMRDIIPDRHHKMSDHLLTEMYKVVKGFVNGQVFLAFLAALLITPALFVLHVSYPVALVAVIFVCGLIPLVGHTIGAVIVTTVALFHSVTSAIIILAYYILYQQIENYLIQPRIQANSTNMSPLLVFASVVIGISFGGLFGGLLAIPVAGCIRIIVLEYFRRHGIISSSEFNRETTSKTK